MERFRIGNVKVVSTMIGFSAGDIASASAATEAASKSAVPVSFSTTFTRSTPENVSALRHVLERGRPVDIEISADESLEGLEEFLLECTKGMEEAKIPPIILCEWMK
jgi:hypothetical protein